MFGIGSKELMIFLVIVLIVFGPKNLPKLARAMGRSVRELKDGLAGVGEDVKEAMNESATTPAEPRPTPAYTVERDDESPRNV